MDLPGQANPPLQEMLRDLDREGIAKAHADLEEMMGGRVG